MLAVVFLFFAPFEKERALNKTEVPIKAARLTGTKLENEPHLMPLSLLAKIKLTFSLFIIIRFSLFLTQDSHHTAFYIIIILVYSVINCFLQSPRTGANHWS